MRNVIRALAPLLAVGCSTVQVRSTPAPNVDLAQLRTFAFMTPVRPDSSAARLMSSPAGQQIRSELTRDLEAKGYTPAPEGTKPDFVVAYRVRLQPRTDVDTWGMEPGWGWGYGGWAWGAPVADVYHYTEGTLIVDFVDPTTHDVLWRGTATGVVNHPHNPNLHKVAAAVDKLMDRYPATSVAAAGRERM
jgi:hypothetical protein